MAAITSCRPGTSGNCLSLVDWLGYWPSLYGESIYSGLFPVEAVNIQEATSIGLI